MITFQMAMEKMVDVLKNDPDFRRIYVDNIACVIMDNAKGFKKDKAKCDELADKIMTHLFGEGK